MKAVIFAAGKGERMMPLTMSRPKPLMKVCGKTIIEWNFLSLEKAGMRHVVVVLGHLGKKISNAYGKRFGKLSIEYVWQDEKMKGTAAALFAAINSVTLPFIAMNGDVIYPSRLIDKIARMKKPGCAVALERTNAPEKMGIALVDEKCLYEIVEKPQIGNANGLWANSGLYRFSPDVFGMMQKLEPSAGGELEITGLVNALARKGKVTPLYWQGALPHFTELKDLSRRKVII